MHSREVERHSPAAIRKRLSERTRHSYTGDAVLGGIDGCVTTFAVVAGAVPGGVVSDVDKSTSPHAATRSARANTNASLFTISPRQSGAHRDRRGDTPGSGQSAIRIHALIQMVLRKGTRAAQSITPRRRPTATASARQATSSLWKIPRR